MISDLLQNILLLLATGLNWLLQPIDIVIAEFLPTLNDALDYITAFFNGLTNVSQWVVSFFGLFDNVLALIVTGIIAPTLISLAIMPIKLGIRWYNSLKIG